MLVHSSQAHFRMLMFGIGCVWKSMGSCVAHHSVQHHDETRFEACIAMRSRSLQHRPFFGKFACLLFVVHVSLPYKRKPACPSRSTPSQMHVQRVLASRTSPYAPVTRPRALL